MRSNTSPPIETAAAANPAGPNGWFAAAVLAVAVMLVYGRALDAPFVFDDEPAIRNNPSIKSLWPLVGAEARPSPLNPPVDLPTSGRPLVNISFAVNHALGGDNPTGYHAVNLTIHFLNSLLVWAIVRRALLLPCFAGRFTQSAGWLALAAALLWALHPLQTETVIYATQRTELLMALCYLATLYCSIRYFPLPYREGPGEGSFSAGTRAHKPLWLTLAVLASLAGMASKEVMVSAPLVVLLFDRTFVSGSLGDALRRHWPLYLGLAVSWVLLAALNLHGPRSSSAGFHLEVSPYAWWLTQCKVVLMYLKLVIWPAPLLLHYQLPYLTTFAGAAVYVVPVALLAFATFILLWQNRPTGLLITFAAAILAPTFVVPVVTETAAERRMYLPLAALIVLFVVGMYSVLRERSKHAGKIAPSADESEAPLTAVILATLLLTLIYGVASAKRLGHYDDETLLWQQVVRAQPANHIARYNLGLLYNYAGREEESFAQLQAAVEAKPDYANARSAFGFALINAGRLPEAVESLQAALAIDPDHVAALNNMGIALARMGRYDDAIDHLWHALRLAPDHAQAHLNLGKALAASGRLNEAVTEFQTAHALAPNDAEISENLAAALKLTGQSPPK